MCLEKYWTDFHAVFTDVFGRDLNVTWAIWEFSEMSHLRTIEILHVRKRVFWCLRLYFWTNLPHIWYIDASGDLQKICRYIFSFFFICAGGKTFNCAKYVCSLISRKAPIFKRLSLTCSDLTRRKHGPYENFQKCVICAQWWF